MFETVQMEGNNIKVNLKVFPRVQSVEAVIDWDSSEKGEKADTVD